MEIQKIDIKTQDGVCDTFIAYPDDKKPYPAVLFLMDGFGPRDYLYEMAKTIASHGFYVLLPNMFYRVRRAPIVDVKFPVRAEDMPEVSKQIMPLFKSYDPEFGVRDIGVFLDFLAQQKQALPGKVGITGYCMGGGLAIRAAARYPDRVAAVASFHGANLATDAPDSPHLLLGNIKAEIYIAHADNDKNMPPEQIERLRSALEQAGIRYEAELYKGAAHGFAMADLPAYNESALKRHWEKLFKFFERSLPGRSTHVPKATLIKAAGNLPKEIHEFIGHVNTGTDELSIAKMVSPQGWLEPGQTPEFNEYSLVLKGSLHLKFKDRELIVKAGQAVIVTAGEWVQYSTPDAGGAEYIAVCVPAFSPKTVHRD